MTDGPHTDQPYFLPVAATGSVMWMWDAPEYHTQPEENPQLAAWKQANALYVHALKGSRITPGLASQIVNYLGTSLAHLLKPETGEIQRKGERVAALPALAVSCGFDSPLRARIETLNKYYCEMGKHPSHHRIPEGFEKLGPSGIPELMRTAQDAWIFRLGQLFPEGIPESQMMWFRQDYDEYGQSLSVEERRD